MKPEDMKRAVLPRSWYHPTWAGFSAYLLFSLMWLPLFGYASVAIVRSDLPLWSQILLVIPSIILAGHGFHMAGWFAHEGVHLSLLPNKYASALAGIFVGGLSLFPSLGYAVTHWSHHRFTNQESDPDTKIYPRYRTFWGRFFMGRVAANRGYFRNNLRVAFKLPLQKGYKVPFNDRWMHRFAVFTLVSIAAWAALYATIAAIDPLYFVFGIFLPYLTAIPASGLRIYIEHNGTGAGIYRDTRSYVSPFWTFVMFGNNHHLEHHLYPTVPAYYLPRVHRLLREQGFFQRFDAHVVEGVIAPLRFLGSDYEYPESLLPDLEADPFIPEIDPGKVQPDSD